MIEPTGYTALDLVGFTDRGTYAANVNYVKNDLVHYGGNIWRILIDDTIGITPAEGTNYTLFIGEPTNLVERIIAPLEDNPATVAYQTGRQIIYNDYLYEVIQDIAIGDILIAYEDDPTNANIKLASPVETQVLALNASKVNKSDIANNVTTTAEGKVLDARQGKALQDGKTDNSVIAPVESGTTASRAYAAGAHFIRDGAFCTAKTNIAQGETFTLNTNYTAGSIASELGTYSSALGTPVASFQGNAATSSSYGNYGCKISKCGNIEKLSIYGQLSSSLAGTGGVLFNLPEGYRPKHESMAQGMGTYNNITKFWNFVVNTNGNITTNTGSNTFTGFINIDSTIILN